MTDENDEATRAWNGVLFDKFERFKPLLTIGLSQHGESLIDGRPPPAILLRCSFVQGIDDPSRSHSVRALLSAITGRS